MQTNNFNQFVVEQNRNQLLFWLPIVAFVLFTAGLVIPYVSRTTYLLDSYNEIISFQIYLSCVAPAVCLVLWLFARRAALTGRVNLRILIILATLVAGLHAILLTSSHTLAPTSVIVLSLLVRVMILKPLALISIFGSSLITGIVVILLLDGNQVLSTHLFLSVILTLTWLIYLGNDHYVSRKSRYFHKQEQWKAHQKITLQILELEAQKKKLQTLAITDSLTGLKNRGYFDAELEKELNRLARTPSPLALVLVDIDHFKQVNDTLGHTVGDHFLQQVAKILKQVFRRSTDSVCRYGGEEFAIIAPNTDANGIKLLAEKLRAELNQANIPHPNGKPLTISIGIAITKSAEFTSSELLNHADETLYSVKKLGRNNYQIIHLEHKTTTT